MGSWLNSNYERIASQVETEFRKWASEYERHLPPPTAMSNVLTTWPFPVYQKQICTSDSNHERIASRIRAQIRTGA